MGVSRDLLSAVRRALADRYTVDREIARGGAACVFLASDPAGQRVALKVLHPELAVSVTAERFLREIGFLKNLEHPRIARFLDCGEADWLLYYVMSYIEGPSLRAHLNRVGHASVRDTLRIADHVLEALAYAHARGIVHRDVKPDNVALADSGAVLLDFGIARAIERAGSVRLTRSGFSVGTSAYMSPEQVEGADDIDSRSDLYSLGCVLFECLAGRPPFTAPREEAVLHKHLHDRAPSVRQLAPEVPEAIADVMMQALAPARDARWPSAEAMRHALALAAAH